MASWLVHVGSNFDAKVEIRNDVCDNDFPVTDIYERN